MTGVESIAILGGTGDLGGGLARQWSRAGYKILIGSRTLEKGEAAAAALLEEFPDLNVTGHENLAAATAADLVVLTVPFEHQLSTLETVKPGLIGKVLIDVTSRCGSGLSRRRGSGSVCVSKCRCNASAGRPCD